MTEKVYLVVACSGDYSDYREYILGVTDSVKEAVQFAKEYVPESLVEDYFWDNTDIFLRGLDFKKFVGGSVNKAEKIAEGKQDDDKLIVSFGPIYGNSDNDYTTKLFYKWNPEFEEAKND
ncbi:hypothetical protein AAHB45_02220 [Pediococcus pentosaceus]|uniref:hypothetical protein n=1 Tax=Pediococcus pentosaceus TaxID=1255 RepID=UPI003168294C